MAKISNVLIGKASGSVGNATFSTWKGINVLKEKAITVANPRSDKQLMRRSALTQVTAIARQLIGVISLGYKKLAIKKSAYNAFQSDALKNAFDYSTPPDAVIQLGSLKISKGTITSTLIDSVTPSVGAGTISMQFAATYNAPGQSASDTPLIAAYNQALNEWAAGSSESVRGSGVGSIPMPGSWTVGNQLDVYLGFYSNIDGASSDSVSTSRAVVA